MNIAYLLVVGILGAGFAYSVRKNNEPLGFATGMLGILLLILSFLAPFGTTVVTEPNYRLEQTQYRVIVKTDDFEQTFEDAYSVLNAGKIEKVRLVQKHNAWGIALESTKDGRKIKLVLKK